MSFQIQKKPNVLFYCQKTRKITDDFTSSIPQNMYVPNDPEVTIDLDAAAREAKDVFEKTCDKFYPRLPTPNEETVQILFTFRSNNTTLVIERSLHSSYKTTTR